MDCAIWSKVVPARPRSSGPRWTGNGSLSGGGPGRSQTCSTSLGHAIAKACWPHTFFEQGAIRPLRSAMDRADDIRQAHFHWVGRRPLRLLGGRVAKPAAGRTHVPEIPADEVTLSGIVVQHGCEGRIGVRLRLAIAESRAH